MPSSLLLVIGIMLPTFQVCNKPSAPIQWPMFWTPHVIAALVFAAVLVRPWQLRGFDIAIRIILGVTVVIWGAAVLPPLCAIAVLFVLPAKSHESAIARCGAITGVLASLWFGAMAFDPDGLWGAYSSLGASIGLTLGCAWWWVEQDWLRSDEHERQLRGNRGIV